MSSLNYRDNGGAVPVRSRSRLIRSASPRTVPVRSVSPVRNASPRTVPARPMSPVRSASPRTVPARSVPPVRGASPRPMSPVRSASPRPMSPVRSASPRTVPARPMSPVRSASPRPVRLSASPRLPPSVRTGPNYWKKTCPYTKKAWEDGDAWYEGRESGSTVINFSNGRF
jgi:hypothetical protein